MSAKANLPVQLCDWPGCIRGHLYYDTKTNTYTCQEHGKFMTGYDVANLRFDERYKTRRIGEIRRTCQL